MARFEELSHGTCVDYEEAKEFIRAEFVVLIEQVRLRDESHALRNLSHLSAQYWSGWNDRNRSASDSIEAIKGEILTSEQ